MLGDITFHQKEPGIQGSTIGRMSKIGTDFQQTFG